MSRPWLARDRFLIAIAPNDQAEQLVRVGKRFADALDAEWLVVSVETPALLKLGERARNRRIDVLRLAESLGAQTVTLDGPSAAAALAEYARLRNITRIVVGRAEAPRLAVAIRRPRRRPSWCGAAKASTYRSSRAARTDPRPNRPSAAPHARSTGVGTGRRRWYRCSARASRPSCIPYFELTNLVMVYLLGATIAALRLGRGPASLTAVVNVAGIRLLLRAAPAYFCGL